MLRTLFATAIAVLPLTACSGATADTSTPIGTLEAGIAALQDYDVAGMLEVLVSDERYNEMKADFQSEKAASKADPSKAKEFNETMARLTQKGAESELFAEIHPELKEMAPMMKMFLPMMAAGLQEGIEEDTTLDPAARAQAKKTVDAGVAWISELDIADEGKLKKAIGVVCSAARKTEFNTWDKVMALNFEGGMGALGEGVEVFADAVAVYGLDLNAAIRSAKVETVSETAEEAVLRIRFELFGPQSFETKMIKHNGRWISEMMMETEPSA